MRRRAAPARPELAAYHHVNTPAEAPQQPDPRPGSYYVSVRDYVDNAGGGRTGILLGPFKLHSKALEWVDRAKAMAERVNDRAFWYAFGTLRRELDYQGSGTLNDLLPEAAEDMACEVLQ